MITLRKILPSASSRVAVFVALFAFLAVTTELGAFIFSKWKEIDGIPASYHGYWRNVSYSGDNDGFRADRNWFSIRHSGNVYSSMNPIVRSKSGNEGLRIDCRNPPNEWSYVVKFEGSDLVTVYWRPHAAEDDPNDDKYVTLGRFARQR
jgi:hypothetical protein